MYRCTMSYDVISLISLLHAQFFMSHYYPINRQTFLQKRVLSSSKMYCIRVTKYACLIYIKYVQCRKSNNKYPCEFVLTRAAKLLYIIPNGDQGTTSKDLVQVPIGPVMGAWAKKFKDVLNGLIQELWAQANSWRPIEHNPRGQQRIITLIKVLEGSGQG